MLQPLAETREKQKRSEGYDTRLIRTKHVFLHEVLFPFSTAALDTLVNNLYFEVSIEACSSNGIYIPSLFTAAPDVYVIGYDRSAQDPNIPEPMPKNITAVRNKHPETRIIAMCFEKHIADYRNAGAHDWVDYWDYFSGKLSSLIESISRQLYR